MTFGLLIAVLAHCWDDLKEFWWLMRNIHTAR